MRAIPSRRGAAGVVALALLALSGCGDSGPTVSGVATYEGQPIESGFISFLPTDGVGATAGSSITNGKFSVTGLAPGQKRVVIVAHPKVEGATPTDMAAAAKRPPAPNLVLENAEGNNKLVDVGTGRQTLDFHLEKPRDSKNK